MHIKLYQTLKSVNVSDDAAAEVVEAVEEYMAVKINEANKGLEAKLNAVLFLIGALTLVIGASAVMGQLVN